MYNKQNIIIIAIFIFASATVPAHADVCNGATYYSAEHELCMDCPPGFDADTTDGKTDISQCRIACPGGYYPTPSDKYVALEYVHFDNRNSITTFIQNRNTAFETNAYLTGDDTLRAVFYPLSNAPPAK